MTVAASEQREHVWSKEPCFSNKRDRAELLQPNQQIPCQSNSLLLLCFDLAQCFWWDELMVWWPKLFLTSKFMLILKIAQQSMNFSLSNERSMQSRQSQGNKMGNTKTINCPSSQPLWWRTPNPIQPWHWVVFWTTAKCPEGWVEELLCLNRPNPIMPPTSHTVSSNPLFVMSITWHHTHQTTAPTEALILTKANHTSFAQVTSTKQQRMQWQN